MQILTTRTQHYSHRCNSANLASGWETCLSQLQSGDLQKIEDMTRLLVPAVEKLRSSVQVCQCAPDDLVKKHEEKLNHVVTELTRVLSRERTRYFYLLDMVERNQLWRKINPYQGLDPEETVEELLQEEEWSLGKVSNITSLETLTSKTSHWVWAVPYRGQPTSFLWMPVSVARKLTSDLKWETILKREEFTPARQEILAGLFESDPRGEYKKMLEVAFNV